MSQEELQKKFLLRLPVNLFKSLKNRSTKSQISINQLMLKKLSMEETSNSNNFFSFEDFNKVRATISSEIIGCILFGSSARGDAWIDSDYDLIFITTVGIDINRSWYRLWDELGFSDKASPLFVSISSEKSPPSFILEAAIDGVVLFDSTGNDIKLYLQSLRKLIAAGKFSRKELHGQPIWQHALTDIVNAENYTMDSL